MRLAERAPERLLAVADENEMNRVGASGNRQKTAAPMLAALARREIAIERGLVHAEGHALARPGAALT